MSSRHAIDSKTTFIPPDVLPETKDIELIDIELGGGKEKTTETVEREIYVPDERAVEAVRLAIALGRPLLLQGDPGCGKTRLAFWVRYVLDLPMELAYIKSTSRAQDLLYTYDAVDRLYDSQMNDERCKDIKNYIRLGPLGKAIARAQVAGKRTVVLLDEIDKADLDFPNDLLNELDRLEFSIPDTTLSFAVPTDSPELRPIVFITNNEEKLLPSAFLRRCIYHAIEFPKERAVLEGILKAHHPEAKSLWADAVGILQDLRENIPDLIYRPGVSELLDWVGVNEARGSTPAQLKELPYLGALLKQSNDQDRAKNMLKEGKLASGKNAK
jgi:MoxR-like ATPase